MIDSGYPFLDKALESLAGAESELVNERRTRQPINYRTRSALTELRQILKQHYPEAKFDVRWGNDDPESIHLVATVDVEDTDAVLDVVIDRLMELQIEEGLPIIHVIPTRPIERVMNLRKKAEKATQLKRLQSPPMIQP